MRKVLSIASAVMIASSVVMAAPVSAQSGGGGGGAGQGGGGGQGGAGGSDPGQTPNQSGGTSTETTSGGGQGAGGSQNNPAGSSSGQQTGQGTGGSGMPGSGGAGSGAQSGGGQQGGGQQGGGQQGGGQQGGGQQGGGQQGGGQQGGGMMQATGSCGGAAGAYGMTNVNSDMVNQFGETVPGLFYRVDYAGLPAPTTVGVIVRFNDELESQTAVQTFTAQGSSGMYEGAIRANISPEAQGFANSIDAGRRGRSDGPPSGGSAEHGNRQPYTQAKGGLQGSGTQGGIAPGDYAFYVYTGEIRNMPETVKDGPAGPRFFADEKGFLGRFTCGVTVDD